MNATARRCHMTAKSFTSPGRQRARGATEEELRGLKVGYRAKSIMRVTEAFVSGEVDEMALRDRQREEQRQALLALYGVGPASVEYILSDVFHHHDAMAHISPWEQKIYSKLFFDRDPAIRRRSPSCWPTSTRVRAVPDAGRALLLGGPLLAAEV